MIFFVLCLEQVLLQDVPSETNATIDFYFSNVTNTLKTDIIPLDLKLNNSKILLISDFHLGKKGNIEQDIKDMLEEMKRLFVIEKPDYIFILGDMIDGVCPTPAYSYYSLVKNLQYMYKYFNIIGGNHDRHLAEAIKANANFSKFINIITDPYIILPTKPKIYLAHDLLHNLRVRDSVVYNYVDHLRSLIKQIEPDDYFLIGHAHTQISTHNDKTFCIGQFSTVFNRTEYTTIITRNSKPFISLNKLPNKNEEL